MLRVTPYLCARPIRSIVKPSYSARVYAEFVDIIWFYDKNTQTLDVLQHFRRHHRRRTEWFVKMISRTNDGRSHRPSSVSPAPPPSPSNVPPPAPAPPPPSPPLSGLRTYKTAVFWTFGSNGFYCQYHKTVRAIFPRYFI